MDTFNLVAEQYLSILLFTRPCMEYLKHYEVSLTNEFIQFIFIYYFLLTCEFEQVRVEEAERRHEQFVAHLDGVGARLPARLQHQHLLLLRTALVLRAHEGDYLFIKLNLNAH